MKASKTIVSSVLILAMIVGAAIIIQLSAPKPVTANVMFDPDTIDLGAPGSVLKEVVVTVWFQGKYDGRDVDPKTVLVDGVLSPKGGWKHTWVERVKIKELKLNTWVFRFVLSAGDLKILIWQKIGHMTPEIVYTLPFEVTGNLYDGTSFAGTGYINAYDPSTTPPTPPPPL